MAFANTSLSAVGILTYKNQNLNAATSSSLPVAIGIASDTLQKWVAPCVYIDNIVLGMINTINLKKQQIVDICSLASSGSPTACALSTTTSGVSAVYASVTNGTVAVGIATTAGNYVGLASTAIVGYGVMNRDTLSAYQFPNLESGNYSTDNPIDSPTYVSLTSSNLGAGKTTVTSQNDGSQLGYVFAISGVGSCVGWASSITTLINDIATLRVGISTYITDANAVKTYKHASQLQYWSYNKVSNDATNTVTTNTSLISVLSNPSYGGPY